MLDFLASISLVGWAIIAVLVLFFWNLPTMLRGLLGYDMTDETTGKRPERPRSDGRIDTDGF